MDTQPITEKSETSERTAYTGTYSVFSDFLHERFLPVKTEEDTRKNDEHIEQVNEIAKEYDDVLLHPSYGASNRLLSHAAYLTEGKDIHDTYAWCDTRNAMSASFVESCAHDGQESLYDLREVSLGFLADTLFKNRNKLSTSQLRREYALHSDIVYYTSIMLTDYGADPLERFDEIEKREESIEKQVTIADLENAEFLASQLNNIEHDADVIKKQQYLINGLEEDAETAVQLYIHDTTINLLHGALSHFKPGDTKVIPRIEELNDRTYDIRPNTSAQIETVEIELPATELDWEVLPPGDLSKVAKDIVETVQSKSEKNEIYIDPTRLLALEQIRTEWGSDMAYYAKGSLGKRSMKRVGEQQCADEYIVLVLQEQTAHGLIEHAVAESPVAGPHAMYVYRGDLQPSTSWREVMSLDKRQARSMGARPIKHPSAQQGEQLASTMASRAGALLAAESTEFKNVRFSNESIRVGNKVAIAAFGAGSIQ